MTHYKKIYFMGIKGVGMASLAIIAKEAGFIVGGSDIEEEFITDRILKERGIEISVGFKEENAKEFFGTTPSYECLFIATGAHQGFDNVEAEYAQSREIKVISHGKAVGLFMQGELLDKNYEGISVAGAHGKTTVSAIVATVLSVAGTDPTYAIGTSEIFPLGPAGHFGQGKYFVAEADEYVSEKNHDPIAKFLYQKPLYLLLNNIDFDHPDFYKDLDSLKRTYEELAQSVPSNGLIVLNGDDDSLKEFIGRVDVRVITFGTRDDNEFILKNFREVGFGSTFEIWRKETKLGDFELSVPGYHNAKNATGTLALLMELGIPLNKIADGLKKFQGVCRRQQIVGKTRFDQTVIDDYAHHPEEIRKTLAAIKLAFPEHKILTIFQFHTYSRTKALFADFAGAFSDASEVIIYPTFSAQRGETQDEDFDKKLLAEFEMLNKRAILINSFENMVEYVDQNVSDPHTIIVTMGAGNVYKIGYKLVDWKK